MCILKTTAFPKPMIIVSQCIEFEYCRYNGQIIRNPAVKELMNHVHFQPVCPEMEIGLGVPRDPIRIVQTQEKQILYQPATHKDVTEQMHVFARHFLESLSNIDGFILKSRSPSCGIKEVKIYPPGEKVGVIGKGVGIFGKLVQEMFSYLPIEDEGRLLNPTIREHFLRTIFTNARFRQIKQTQSLSELVTFHTQHKLMFMAYNQQQLKVLGQIVANHRKQGIERIFTDYETHLHRIFQRSPRCTSNINVLMHAYGYFKEQLSKKERTFFLETLNKYRNAQVSLASLINILKSWIIRFEEPYLSQQLYFSPYPDALMHPQDIDSCVTKDYWK